MDLRPAGSFIQNTPTGRRQSVNATPSRRASTQATPQVPATVQNGEGTSQGEVDRHPRPRRPASAWKNRHRRPQFTDNFDAFDDPVVDLDSGDDQAAEKNPTSSSPEATTGSDVVKPAKDLSKFSRAWQDNTATNAISAEHLLYKPADVARSNFRRGSQQLNDTGSENWTSSGETSKRGSLELAPDFELSHIRAKVLQKYHATATAAAARAATRPRSAHPRPTVVGSRAPTRPTAVADDIGGVVAHPRRQTLTPQHRLTPIDKRSRNRATKKRRGRRPEATEVTSQHGGGGPKYRVTSGGRRGRLKPLISRRSRLVEMTQVAGAPAAKLDVKQPTDSRKTDSHPQILERGTTFTSSVIVSDVLTEGCRAPSTFQLHHLPLNLSASTSGSDLEFSSPLLKSSET